MAPLKPSEIWIGSPPTPEKKPDPQQIVTWANYVQGVAESGIRRLAAADVATTANITLSGEQTIDGVATSASRVLVKDQTTGTENGVYVSAAGAWARAPDADTDAEIANAIIQVTGGTAGAGTNWQVSGSPIIGTDAIIFSAVDITGDLTAIDARLTSVEATLPTKADAADITDLTAIDAAAEGVGFRYIAGGRIALDVGSDGTISGAFGPERIDIGYSRTEPPGIIQDGAITDITHMGDYWRYRSNGVPVLVHDAFPNFTPALIDTPVFDVAMRNGQSWNTQLRLTEDLDDEDATGRTRARVEGWNTAEFQVTRSDTDFAPASPWENSVYYRRAYSTDAGSGASGPVTGLRNWKPGRVLDSAYDPDFFTVGDIASATRQYFLREWGARRYGLVSLQCGMAGRDESFFLAPGSTFVGSGGTVSASIEPGNARTFFENDTIALDELRAIIRTDWLDKRMSVSVETFDQGGAGAVQATDDDSFYNFLSVRRQDVDSRGVNAADGGAPWLIVPQGFSASKETFAGWQPMDQLRWGTEDPTDRDIVCGPFYHLLLLQESAGQSAIHGTAMHNLRKGEHIGLIEAIALDARIAEKPEPFRIVSAVLAGSTITLTLNNPLAANGAPQIDTTTIESVAGKGFALKDFTGDVVGSNIGFNDPVIVDDTTITIAITGSLAGVTKLELSYALRGVAASEPAVGAGGRPACVGNIKRPGRYVGPFSGAVIDTWLAEHIEILTV